MGCWDDIGVELPKTKVIEQEESEKEKKERLKREKEEAERIEKAKKEQEEQKEAKKKAELKLLKERAKQLDIDVKGKNSKDLKNLISKKENELREAERREREQEIRAKKEELERVEKEKQEKEEKYRVEMSEKIDLLITQQKESDKKTTYLLEEIKKGKDEPKTNIDETLVKKLMESIEEMKKQISSQCLESSLENLASDVMWEYLDTFHQRSGNKPKDLWKLYRPRDLARELNIPNNEKWKTSFKELVDKGFLVVHPQDKNGRFTITPKLIEEYEQQIEEKQTIGVYLTAEQYKNLLVDEKGEYRIDTFSQFYKKLTEEKRKKAVNMLENLMAKPEPIKKKPEPINKPDNSKKKKTSKKTKKTNKTKKSTK